MEIFEQYFYDINQFNRVAGNTQEYSDMLTLLYEKIAIFEDEQSTGWMSANMPVVGGQWMTVPEDLIYRLGTVRIGANQCEMLNSKDFDLARQSPLTSPTLARPIAYLSRRGLSIYTSATQFITHANVQDVYGIGINLSYTMNPPTIQWAYVIVNDKPLYNNNISVSFKLHASEETELVYKILKLAGVNLKAPQVVQVAAGMEQSQLQQEKK